MARALMRLFIAHGRRGLRAAIYSALISESKLISVSPVAGLSEILK